MGVAAHRNLFFHDKVEPFGSLTTPHDGIGIALPTRIPNRSQSGASGKLHPTTTCMVAMNHDA
jgi:hypothetical protein